MVSNIGSSIDPCMLQYDVVQISVEGIQGKIRMFWIRDIVRKQGW